MVGASKLNWDDVRVIKDLLEMGKTHQSIADMFGVSRELISSIKSGKRWNKEQHSFIMKDEQIKSNDFRDFGAALPIKSIEVVKGEKDQLDLDQKYYMVKFIESLTGKKIKKLIIEF